MSKSTRTLLLLLALAVLLVTLRLVDRTWAPSLEDVVGQEVLARLQQPWFTVGGKPAESTEGLPVTPVLIIQSVLFLTLLTALARLGRRVLHGQVLGHTSLDTGQQYAIARIFGYTVFVGGLMVGLQTMGLDLSSLAFLGGAVGIGIGFGLQAIVNNFVSGLILLIERPVKVGDRVDVGGATGDVVRIGPRCTWIRSVDTTITMVPNSELVTGRVTNWTAEEELARYRVSVGVSYESDPEQVRRILLDVAAACPGVEKHPAPDVILSSLADSAIRFDLRFFTRELAHRPNLVSSELYFAILRAFREQGVRIPYPQHDVHVRTVPDGLVGTR